MTPEKQKIIENLGSAPLWGYRFFIFLVQIAIVIVCIQFSQIFYDHTIFPDKHVKENFSQTACRVADKKMSEKGHIVHRYRSDFLIQYSVDAKPYSVWVTGNGLDQGFFHARDLQELTLTQFDVGSSYPCWYNPAAPEMAVLVMRHNWTSTLPLAVPTILGLIAAYYVLKNFLRFIGILRLTIHEKKTRFKK